MQPPQMQGVKIGPLWDASQFNFEPIASRQTEGLVGDSLSGTPNQMDMFGSVQKSIMSDAPSARDRTPQGKPIQALRMNK